MLIAVTIITEQDEIPDAVRREIEAKERAFCDALEAMKKAGEILFFCWRLRYVGPPTAGTDASGKGAFTHLYVFRDLQAFHKFLGLPEHAELDRANLRAGSVKAGGGFQLTDDSEPNFDAALRAAFAEFAGDASRWGGADLVAARMGS